MKRHVIYILVFVIQAIAISACSNSTTAGAETPQEAVAIYHKALLLNDPDLLWTVWRESGFNAAKLHVAIHKATLELDNAIEAKYGDYGSTGRVRGTYRVDVNDLLENAKVDIADEFFGSIVIGGSSDTKNETNIVKHDRAARVFFNVEYVQGIPADYYFNTLEIDGRWYVHLAGATVDPDQDRREEKVVEILDEARRLVVSEGLTIKEIDWYVRVLKQLAKDLAVVIDPQDEQSKKEWLGRQCSYVRELSSESQKLSRSSVNEILADKLIVEIGTKLPLANNEREQMLKIKTQNIRERRNTRKVLFRLLCEDGGNINSVTNTQDEPQDQKSMYLEKWKHLTRLSGGCSGIQNGNINQDQQQENEECATRGKAFWTGRSEDFSVCLKESECPDDVTGFKRLFTSSEISDLTVDIFQSGLSLGLDFQLFRSMDAINGGSYEEQPIEIKVAGKRKELQLFIESIANRLQALTIDDVLISQIPESESQLIMSATIRGYVAIDEND